MTGASKRRAGRFFPQEVDELREIARTVKTFGLIHPFVGLAVTI